jgi:lysine 6-dehydrogenase
MQILVLGGGLMGPAAAFNALSDPDVSQVTVCDVSETQLEACQHKLANKAGAHKLTLECLDLNDQATTVKLMSGYDAIVAALPSVASPLGMRAAIQARVPLVDLTWAPAEQLPAIKQAAEAAGSLIIPGCGVEPGLTEIMARYASEQLDSVTELHIKCGGIPAVPTPPLGYKIVFGGKQMPLRESDAQQVKDGQLQPVARYTGVESVTFAGVGECEAWHEGFMPWLLELPSLQGLKVGTQKTVRWPGYAAKATVLKELGLLSLKPVEVEGARVTPKKVVDAVLYPQVRLGEHERDITTFRVDALGVKHGHACHYRIELVDRYDEALGFTSMARTTAFTAAIVARMVARGDLKASGLVTPEKLLTGAAFERLVNELAANGMRFAATTMQTQILGQSIR